LKIELQSLNTTPQKDVDGFELGNTLGNFVKVYELKKQG
jgi:hypothetical protein